MLELTKVNYSRYEQHDTQIHANADAQLKIDKVEVYVYTLKKGKLYLNGENGTESSVV